MTMRIGPAPGLEQPPPVAKPVAADRPGPSADAAGRGERFRAALGGLGKDIDHGEQLVRRALGAGGGHLGAGDLIALQAGIYRYSEAVDLAAKLVDHAGSAIKTTLRGSG